MQVICVSLESKYILNDAFGEPLVPIYVCDFHNVFYGCFSYHKNGVSKPVNADWIKFLVEKVLTQLTSQYRELFKN